MTFLVVNADDAGAHAARNRGIRLAWSEGIVTSISVLAAFPDAAEAVADARRGASPPGIGLHIDLTEGRPLVPGARTLVDADGAFPGKMEVWRRGLMGGIDRGEAAGEIAAQWERLRALGADPDHADGHNHVHILPGVTEAMADALPEGIWVRLPCESAPDASAFGRTPEELFADKTVLCAALAERCRIARSLWDGRFRLPDGFVGARLTRGYSQEELIDAVLAAGGPNAIVMELMTHPGSAPAEGERGFGADPARAREADALRSPALREALGRAGIRLARFGDLP